MASATVAAALGGSRASGDTGTGAAEQDPSNPISPIRTPAEFAASVFVLPNPTRSAS